MQEGQAREQAQAQGLVRGQAQAQGLELALPLGEQPF